MDAFFHYLPYILGLGIAVLIVVCLLDWGGGSSRKHVEPWRPKQKYPHKYKLPQRSNVLPPT